MPPSDNESSDDETDAFTTTNVLLGYASKEPTDDLFSQLGGYPVCPTPTTRGFFFFFLDDLSK